jgi:hypothetical protein
VVPLARHAVLRRGVRERASGNSDGGQTCRLDRRADAAGLPPKQKLERGSADAPLTCTHPGPREQLRLTRVVERLDVRAAHVLAPADDGVAAGEAAQLGARRKGALESRGGVAERRSSPNE